MSEGRRSLVNWIRLKEQSRDRARAWASVVFPTPGTSSIKRCPRAKSAMMDSLMASFFPLMICSILR